MQGLRRREGTIGWGVRGSWFGQKIKIKTLAPQLNAYKTYMISIVYLWTYLFALSIPYLYPLALVRTPQLLFMLILPFPHPCASMHNLPLLLIPLLLAAPWLLLLPARVCTPLGSCVLACIFVSFVCDTLSVKSIISILTLIQAHLCIWDSIYL